jgi:glycosyltransferase involved in cell wall biosynthesis
MHNFSIIVPCQNEEKNIEKFVVKVESLLKDKYNFKILFIDDGSLDNTWNIIENIKKRSSFISGIKLSKNFGKENAICCGLNNIKNEDFIITADADLQHPLEKIEEMINLWKNGYKIINTYRTNQTENNLREVGSKLFYFFIKKFSDLTIVSKTTDFILIDKEVVKKFNEINEANKQYRTLINWLGFKKANLPIKIHVREDGISKYKLNNLLNLALNNITSFSAFPLKIIAYIGLSMTVCMFIILLIIFMNKLIFNGNLGVKIESILIIIQILLTGIILSSISFLGIYIRKIVNNTNNRPSYIIEKNID